MRFDEVHRTKGKVCSYVLRCEGDRIYCGHTKDLELRLLQHMNAAPGGAKFCLEYPPQEILCVRIHETEEEALAMECAQFNFWCGKLKDFDRVRGGRLNGTEPLKFAIRGWNPQWNVERESEGLQ